MAELARHETVNRNIWPRFQSESARWCEEGGDGGRAGDGEERCGSDEHDVSW